MSVEAEKNFKFASSLIKIIAILIAAMVAMISRYAFIFFSVSMLPTIFAIFLDKNEHRCLSATICSFNLIGVMPYLTRIWEANSIDYVAKLLLADISTWMIVYGAVVIGQLLYISMPLLIVKFYSARMKVRVAKFQKQHKILCEQWGIETK
ncbi:MAG: hypothetical protein EKK61_03160 [Rickettsiales bacterium]|nr:MAG: hypothetical protein EKK61_03160 [Rickettsiales bacterium]